MPSIWIITAGHATLLAGQSLYAAHSVELLELAATPELLQIREPYCHRTPGNRNLDMRALQSAWRCFKHFG